MNDNRLPTRTEATVRFVDMNRFVVSCEQQDNPLLRGLPVVCVHE